MDDIALNGGDEAAKPLYAIDRKNAPVVRSHPKGARGERGVSFRSVDASLLDAGQNLADDFLAGGRVRVMGERLEVGDQVAAHKA